MPRDAYHSERRGTPVLGILFALVLIGCAAAVASMTVTDGPTECGTALSQRAGTSGAARVEVGQAPATVGKIGCEKAITDRRLQIGVGLMLGLGLVLYVAVSSSGPRGGGG